MMTRFDVVPIETVAPNAVVDVINEAFGRNESLAWYQWKHLEGPWGPSIGVAAVDGSGVLGVRLLLPWCLKQHNKTFVTHRATEAATVPRAQGQGVFTALNRWMMEQVETQMIFSTPNELSRGGYYKLGWKTLDEIRYRWEATRPRLLMPDRSFATESSVRLATAWDTESLRWRTDERCRHRYATVNQSGSILYYRLLHRAGLTGVAPLGLSGEQAALAPLWREMVARTRAAFVLRPISQPTPYRNLLAVTRGRSLLVGWTPPGAERTMDGWAAATMGWLHADLEAVM